MKQRMTLKEFAESHNILKGTVKRLCKKNVIEYHKDGPRYSIDVDQAEQALKELDNQQRAINTPIKRVTQHRHGQIKTEADFLREWEKLKNGIA
ncbi:hypothetical protein [Pectinatus frisingensis]|uniref:hypothetical protein n=1 Tax=Pectinatus frisingensis TaxID=865 RepID=UPI0018C840A9|nr:hypothetical protein [Pectinatus frisingensis]